MAAIITTNDYTSDDDTIDDTNDNTLDIKLSSFTRNNEEAERDDKTLLNTGDNVKIVDDVHPNIKFFLCVAWVTFLGEMSRGVVVPILWPYLQTLHGTIQFLGVVSSGFSAARFFAAPFFGWWSNKRGHKEVMQICLVLLIVGNLIYALYPPPWVLLISRIIVGLGAGTLGQSRGYVSQVTTKAQRTKFMAYLTVSQFAGFAVTPGITSLLSFVDFDIFGSERLEADQYSSAGYLLALLSLGTIFVITYVFVEPPKQAEVITEYIFIEVKPKVSRGTWETLKTSISAIPKLFAHPEFNKIVIFAALIFATRTAVAVVETSSSQLGLEFSWNSQKLSYILCALGVVGTIVLISLPEMCKKIGKNGEGILLCVGVFSLGTGLALMIHNTIYTFVLGLFFTWAIGSSLCQTLIISFLSRVLNPNSQGAVMGWLASLGSVSRIIGSLWTGATLSNGALLSLGVPSALMLPCLFGTFFLIFIQRARTPNIIPV